MVAAPGESLGRASRLVVFSFLLYAPYYLYWRLDTLNPDALFFSWLVWGAEVFGFVGAVLHVFMVYRTTNRMSLPVAKGLAVDVFIPTYNETSDLLRHTVAAACRMDYPHTTWILDDGNRPEIRALAERYNCRYLARTTNEHAKAGNLNNALRQATGDFVAIFDADHVPGRSFLTKTLGFFADKQVAFVQTPQDFYNLDSFQHRKHKYLNFIWTEQSLFFRVIQRGKDYWNAAFFCGSCAVIRRSALDKIGGFATGTITEDLHTSIRLHKQGFKSVYYPESLAFGVAPNSIRQFLVQRKRWGRGAMQVWRREGIIFSRGLNLAQRLNYLASVATYFDGWQKLVFYSAPVIVLLSGVLPINVLGWEYLAYFIPYYLLCFWAYEEVGRGYGRSVFTEEFNMARFAVFAQSTFGWFGDRQEFHVTDKNHDRGDDSKQIIPQLFILFASLFAIVAGIALWFAYHHLTPMALWVNVIWAGLNLGLAGFVARYTLQRRHRRREYRFAVPLTGKMVDSLGQTMPGVIGNISSGGLAFVCDRELKSQQEVTGEIFLPGRKVLLQGKVCYSSPLIPSSEVRGVHDTSQYVQQTGLYEYGLQVKWQSARDQEEIEKFLFGTDAQWRMLGLHEQALTPITRIRTWVERDAGHSRLGATFRTSWMPVYYETAKERNVGVLFLSGDYRTPARLLTLEQTAPASEFHCQAMGSGESGSFRGQLHNVRQVETDYGVFYAADFNRYPLLNRSLPSPVTQAAG